MLEAHVKSIHEAPTSKLCLVQHPCRVLRTFYWQIRHPQNSAAEPARPEPAEGCAQLSGGIAARRLDEAAQQPIHRACQERFHPLSEWLITCLLLHGLPLERLPHFECHFYI